MSSRVTRSFARGSAGLPNNNNDNIDNNPPNDHPPPQPPGAPPSTRKRKISGGDSSPQHPSDPTASPPRRRSKRTKTEPANFPSSLPSNASQNSRPKRGKPAVNMANAGPSNAPPEEPLSSTTTAVTSASKRKSSRNKGEQDTPASSGSQKMRRSKKSAKPEQDTIMKDVREPTPPPAAKSRDKRNEISDDSEEGPPREHYDEEDEDGDPFEHGGLQRHGALSMSNSLRALSGILSGTHFRLRGILEKLKQKDDPSVQLIALQELSELLLVSTEDNLAGHFSPDPYIKELVALMQPNEFGDENPEIMLLACRCLANMMEALPSSTANVVYGGAVPILCQKLLEIHFIDLAEQALSTLEKISVEFPGHIVREGGLTACLTYLDFFATGTQRTAVTTAANCCRNISEESFATVRDVMPILLNVLDSSDQKVLEQGCICVSRIVESFKYNHKKLEELVDAKLLRAILRLLLPGTTNLIGAAIHTQFLRVLAFTARASPKRSVELFKINVVDTLYQILTGVSPPSGADGSSNNVDSVHVMQALIHRPRDQIFETLNVICELLPDVSDDSLHFLDSLFDAGFPGREFISMMALTRSPANTEKRSKLLEECRDELKRFTIILLPTLTDTYSSTVNLSVRQKVLTAQLKMLSNLDVDILEDALRNVPYASFLASIVSQRDHPSLVTYGLQAAELLLKRLESTYRYQFYREGVISEIKKLATRPLKSPESTSTQQQSTLATNDPPPGVIESEPEDDHEDIEHDDEESDFDETHEEEHSEEEHEDDESHHGGIPHSESSISSEPQALPVPANVRIPDPDDRVTNQAKKFIEAYETDGLEYRSKAASTLEDLRQLTQDIRSAYVDGRSEHLDSFKHLAKYFDQDDFDSITSYEILSSNIVDVLLEVLSDANPRAVSARSAFMEAFTGRRLTNSATTTSPATPFSVLIHKLQDLLSRAEHFEVITVHQNSYDSSRGSAVGMLAKQLRLKLSSDDDPTIPKHFRNLMVSIHAIANFESLADWLRPRIANPDLVGSKRREQLMSAMEHARALLSRRDGLIPPPGVPSPGDLNSRITKRISARKDEPSSNTLPAEAGSSSGAPKLPNTRQSSRRRQPQTPVPPPPPPPPPESGDHIECADEAQISDENEMNDEQELRAIVNSLQDDLDGDDDDASAANVEVASTGRVTARKDDGTRIATPVGNNSALSKPPSTSRSSSNPLSRVSGNVTSPTPKISYAAAIQSVPQDWHIEFSVNGLPVTDETTVYRAVHFNQAQPNEVSARNIWSAIHTVEWKKVPGPPPQRNTLNTALPESVPHSSEIPSSISQNPTTSAILRLLGLLHGLNANIDDIVVEKSDGAKLITEPPSLFVNTKLTAKMNRQLEEPLIVASQCLPSWSEDLARLYPFLFPFETRHLFLQSTSFGYARTMNRWQGSQTSEGRLDRHRDERPFLGKIKRQKVRISRNDILKAALKVMELYGHSQAILEVEYFEEVGTGLGPTLEFYSTVSKEFAKKKLKMWRENESAITSEYAFGSRGLFPSPMSDEYAETDNGKRVLALFFSLGKFVARSMLDSRIIDINFNPTFFRVATGLGSVTPSLGAVRTVDYDLANSLQLLKKFATAKQAIDEDYRLSPAQKVQSIQEIEIDHARVDDLALDFTLPGYPSIELIPGGSGVAVTIDNVGEYMRKVLDFTVGGGVKRQAAAFRAGFSHVFPFEALRAFTPNELVMLFGRVEEDWTLETLMDSIKADHGFNLDSRSVRNLLQIMSELTLLERRDFLQFVTGSPKLPIGGFKALTPMFTVVCKPSEAPYTSDDYLPSVMTCVNYLKLPDYSTIEVMRAKLSVAIKEGQGAFHLS